MELYHIKVYHKQSSYDYIFLNYSIMFRANDKILDNQLIDDNFACGDHKIYNRRILLQINGIEAHYIVKELSISGYYRSIFISKLKNLSASQVIIKLRSAKKEIIDYKCNDMNTYLVWERLELDHALSWLSTLGGAFSALGDYFPNAAEMAGRISRNQFKLALRLGDPNVQARCRLFLSLSLIQQGYYRLARRIILTEYSKTKNSIVRDERLVKMCLGIWAKLKYEWNRKKLTRLNIIL